ncbi:sugar 3,4-ketoisomerase [Comamonas terrigena]|uniref:sugar 3,4-ketoisomerase n=1 Tax=Comamonas terrigena TaxID=32013 RepID=UPI002449ABB6|nr:FdtA/QdtA family cupin domain-containing protein [Comamonas terrigena]MDH1700757.1 FdtA/QdtA family cupin domain-containing protein [Comamonas terrigena]
MSLAKWIDFQVLGDERGSLVSIEQGKLIPFEIQRIYYLYNTGKDISRGFHAHRQLRQVAICVSGACRMVLDNGHVREEVWLDCPTKGLLIESMTWREMHDFSTDCVLMVIASMPYDESDYIRNYQAFLDAQSVGCVV